MIDPVTVVFRDEIPFLRVQARSLDLYTRDITVGKVIVVVNDHVDVCQQIDPEWWGRLADQVVIIPAQRWCNSLHCDGWVSQQALKILASATGISQWNMILDAKTFLVQNIDPNRLFQAGRVCMGQQTILPVFSESQRLVNQLFDVNMTQVAGPSGVPHFFKRDLIVSLLDHLEPDDFYQWFLDQGKVTEFVLYSGWVHCQLGSLDPLYSEAVAYQVTNICHSQTGRFDQLLADAVQTDNLSLGIHRNAWRSIDHQCKRKYLLVLQNFGLITDADATLSAWDQALL
jgi:hypothetical protein